MEATCRRPPLADPEVPPPRWVYSTLAEEGLRSSYAALLGREPPFTSVKPGFMHTIDYCFYTDFSVRQQRAAAASGGGGGDGGGDGGSQLAVRGVLDVVDHRSPEQGGDASPCRPWPSDHLALCVQFGWK